MGDFEELLRSEIARHRDSFAPSDDLGERIHARVAKRRRQRRALAGAAGLGLAAVVVAGALLASPSSHQTVEVADDHDRSTTTAVTPSTTGGDDMTSTTEPTEAPSTTGSPDATGDTSGSGSTGGAGGPGSTTGGAPEGSSPPTTRGTATTTTETGDLLLAPDGDTPAAGTCGTFGGAIVEVVLNPDIPSPRCVEVTADQRLQVRNAAGETVTVYFAGSSVTLGDGDAHLFDQPFGDYLAPGVHRVSASIYGDSGAEIWLQP